MGNLCAGIRISGHGSTVSDLDREITQILRKKKAILDSSDEKHRIMSFNKVILQFSTIQRAMRKIKDAFNCLDVDQKGSIDYVGLRSCLKLLGTDISDDVMKQIFAESDFTSKGALSYKEFVVSLAIVYLMGAVPSLSGPDSVKATSEHNKATASDRNRHHTKDPTGQTATSTTLPNNEPRASTAWTQERQPSSNGPSTLPTINTNSGTKEPDIQPLPSPVREAHRRGSNIISDNKVILQKAFHLLVDAYLFFDKDASGTISKDEMRAVLIEDKSKPRSAELEATAQFLTQHRWEEMDWNKDGTITFKEFLFAFESWVYDEEDQEEEISTQPSAGEGYKHSEETQANSILRKPKKT